MTGRGNRSTELIREQAGASEETDGALPWGGAGDELSRVGVSGGRIRAGQNHLDLHNFGFWW